MPPAHPNLRSPAPWRGRCRAWLLLVVAALQPACGAGWRRIEATPRSTLAPRQQVQLWSQGHVRRWHAVRWSADSVSGVPFLQAIACDTCRLTVAQGTIDSVRIGNPTGGFLRSVGLTLGTMAVAGLVLCGIERSCNFGD